MTQICMVRHGQTDWNLVGKLQGQTDIPLNETGIRQAQECREFLKDCEWDVVVTTSLMRARKTAEIINEALDLNIVEMDHFKERCFGEGEGMLREDRDRQFPDFIFPEMESHEDLVERVQNGLNEIHKQFRNQRVLVVAHGAVINTILQEYHNDALGERRVKLWNGCLTELHLAHDTWIVRSFNQVGHLSEHA